MFTGLIKHIATIEGNTTLADGSILLRIKFRAENDQTKTLKQNLEFFEETKIGDSVSINGICLTVVKIDSEYKILDFFVSKETIQNTTIMTQFSGNQVNAEFAMKASDKLGGHIVSGHIDEVIKLKSINELGDSFVLGFECSSKSSFFLIKKGSIAIDGVSLTINSVFKNTFEVCIIPHTWQHTILKNLNTANNNLCNAEYDYFAKIINKNLMQMRSSGFFNQKQDFGGLDTTNNNRGNFRERNNFYKKND